MTRPTDSQRSRVYKAERKTFKWGQTIPDALLQAACNEILDMRVVRSRWPRRKITVERGRGGGMAYDCWLSSSRITLGVEARNEWVMCHEIAHCLTNSRCAAHGLEFVGVYLFLIKAVLGEEPAIRLSDAFKECKAKRSTKGIPAVRAKLAPRQYERLADVRARVLPPPEVMEARSAAARKAWATRKAASPKPVVIAFPMRIALKKMADEMQYQHAIDVENHENEYEAAPQWRMEGSVLVMDSPQGLYEAWWRADIACDYDMSDDRGLQIAARMLRDRLARLQRLAKDMTPR